MCSSTWYAAYLSGRYADRHENPGKTPWILQKKRRFHAENKRFLNVPNSRLTSALWDHPRVCGEYGSMAFPWGRPMGSPPRVRGVHLRQQALDGCDGITPACAGSTSLQPSPSVRFWDHPRVCGEYSAPRCGRGEVGGSPPRVRGVRDPPGIQGVRPGITPACAGSTRPSRHPGSSTRDHPRVCGEYCTTTGWLIPMMGSPPRVRGVQ